MTNLKYQYMFPISELRRRLGSSERSLAASAQISRRCLRMACEGDRNVTLQSLVSIAEALDREVEVALVPPLVSSDCSTVAVAYKVERDGFESWKVHFMDLVDELRRTLDPRLCQLPPHRAFDKRLTALLAALVRHLSDELGMAPPAWAARRHYLEIPWFVSGMNSLKASAILESPFAFRNNNIFVHKNFAARV